MLTKGATPVTVASMKWLCTLRSSKNIPLGRGRMEIEATEGSNEFTVTFDRRQMPYHSILERLIAAGVRIDNIRPVGNQLEQVFVSLTKQ